MVCHFISVVNELVSIHKTIDYKIINTHNNEKPGLFYKVENKIKNQKKILISVYLISGWGRSLQ